MYLGEKVVRFTDGDHARCHPVRMCVKTIYSAERGWSLDVNARQEDRHGARAGAVKARLNRSGVVASGNALSLRAGH